MTVSDQYRYTVNALSAVTDEPEAEARELMAHVYSLPPGRLIMRFLDEADYADRLNELINERLAGKPLAYVTGERCFYGLNFITDERVLIPRYDTESVAEAAVKAVRSGSLKRAVDMCCGSGCIGLTLLMETELSEVLLTDVSEDALEVARQNAERLGLSDRARFACGDLYNAVPAKTDLIVCNPPYISEEEYPLLEPQVRDYEPRNALVAKENGMYFYRRLASGASEYLSRGGIIIAETGAEQAEAVSELFRAAGLTEVSIGKDLAGRQRFVQGRSASCRTK